MSRIARVRPAEVVVAALFAARFRNLLAASEHTRFLQAWQLRQAVPEGARALNTAASASP